MITCEIYRATHHENTCIARVKAKVANAHIHVKEPMDLTCFKCPTGRDLAGMPPYEPPKPPPPKKRIRNFYNDTGIKKCSNCGMEGELRKDFYASNSKGGYQSWCKSCSCAKPDERKRRKEANLMRIS